MTIMSYSFLILPCVSVRACVIEKKLQERLRKVPFADSEKLKIIVKPGQEAPIHRKQNLRGLPKAHERAAPSQCLKSMTLWGGRRSMGLAVVAPGRESSRAGKALKPGQAPKRGSQKNRPRGMEKPLRNYS